MRQRTRSRWQLFVTGDDGAYYVGGSIPLAQWSERLVSRLYCEN
jgi:hypothetical protein